ncbi:MAG: extracellular solute-binding protein [Candidatus Omnitrophica bacterium]|nr:extracellular solute-binding protein [Candidatus Omnitrophota bacterium]
MLRIILGLGVVCSLAVMTGCSSGRQEPKSQETLTILWAKWAASDYLQTLSEGFTRETGIKVIVKQVAWGDFYSAFFDHAQDYDMVGGDSQWLGIGSTGGYYVDLTKWVIDKGVDQRMTEASVVGYAEYPKGSKRYWGVPLMGDAMGFAYRKDLFEDPKEKAAFQARYGYPLDVPKTWEQLKDIATFFYRPQQNFYGVNVWATEDYDATTMGVETFIWAWGADIGDQKTYKVKGVLNVPASAQALKFYKDIYETGAPEWKHAYLEINEAFFKGKVAMVMSYFAFFPDLLNPAKNPYASVTGFFANPAGPKGRYSSLGGQGLSVVSYSRKKDQIFKFLDWFVRPDVQREWARLGGYSCDKAVLNSEEFLKAQPYNRALRDSMGMLKDFWVVPEYAALLAISQKYWTKYLFSDAISAEEVMNTVAREWESLFEISGYYKE